MSKQHYFGYVGKMDLRQQEMAAQLKKWSEINTHTENLKGIEAFIEEIYPSFAALHPDEMRVVSLPRGRKGLFLKKGAKAAHQFFLGGHLDTVFSLQHPFQKAAFLDPLTLQGPGVADMKGGLLILLQSLLLLEAKDSEECIGWEVFLNSDEEIGSPDSTPFLEQCAQRCDCALIFEPRLEDGFLVSRRKGSCNYTFISRGKKAHAGRDLEKGKNAIYPLAEFIVAISALHRPASGPSINVGVVQGGEGSNVVPDYAECRVNIRAEALSTQSSVEKHIEALAVERGLEMRRTAFHPPKIFDKKTEELFLKLKECGSKLGLPIAWRETGGVCDGNTFAAQGVPTIDTMGVRGGNIHTEHEFVRLDSLHEQIELTTLFLTEIAQGGYG